MRAACGSGITDAALIDEAAPCTTIIRGLPSEVVLEPDSDPIPLRSAVNLDSVESVSVAALVSRLGRLPDVRMRAVCAALEVAVDCSA